MKKLLQRIFGKTALSQTEIVGIEIGNGWLLFDNGKTIGKKGSEGGKILVDQEYQDGARIALEENAGKIPFAITFGIYGLMFHTEFFSDLPVAKEYIEKKKLEIAEILKMYDIVEEQRDSKWYEEHNSMLEKLIY